MLILIKLKKLLAKFNTFFPKNRGISGGFVEIIVEIIVEKIVEIIFVENYKGVGT